MKKLKLLLTTLLLTLAGNMSAQKYVGGDISLLTKYEENGAKYLDHNGNAISEVLPFLKEQGLNAMRVRLFVDPSNATTTEKGEGVCQDLAYVIALSKRIKAAGFKLMLDFHYSDTWADPSKQWTPAGWTSLTDAQLYSKIYDYTKDVLQQLVAADATPDFIQTGNEISYGMLWGARNTTANRCYINSTANWDRFGNLLKQAGKACREVCPNARIVIHTERVAQPSVLTGFYDKMKSLSVDYDIIGLSYYPYFHGKLDVLESALKVLAAKYTDKQVMIVETGYPYAWEVNGTTIDYTTTYPYSDDGQKAFTTDLITLLNKYNQVTGLFWWFMEANEYGLDWNTKRVTDKWYNAPLFDNRTGKATSALSALKDFISNPAGINTATTAPVDNRNWYTLNGQRTTQPTQKGIYINNGRKFIVK